MSSPNQPTLLQAIGVVFQHIGTFAAAFQQMNAQRPAFGDPDPTTVPPIDPPLSPPPPPPPANSCDCCAGNTGWAILACDGATVKKIPCAPNSTFKTDNDGKPAFVAN